MKWQIQCRKKKKKKKKKKKRKKGETARLGIK